MPKSEKQRKHLERLIEMRRNTVSPLKGRKRPKFSDEWIKRMKNAQKKYFTSNSAWNKGRECKKYNWGRKGGFKLTEAERIKMSDGQKRRWDKIGRVENYDKIDRRYDIKGRLWRGGVFERDNYTCQDCGKRGGGLEAHHIKGWSKYPKLRYVINNGITYCIKCHKKNDFYRR